jgi:hypothetical protein
MLCAHRLPAVRLCLLFLGVGRDTALHALNRYVRRADAQPRRLVAIARELGGKRRLADALEAVMS